MEIRKMKAFDVSSATAPTSVPDEPSSPAKLGGSFMPSDDEVYDTAFISSSSNCVAVATNSGELRIQSLDRAEHVGLVHGHTQSILCVDSPGWDDNLIASGSKDNSILFWRLRETKAETDVGTRQNEAKTFTADRIALATGHAHSVASIAFSRSKNLPFLVSVSTDTTLKLWPLTELIVKQEQEGEQHGNLKMSASATVVAHSKDINGVDVSANDKLCVTASMDKTAKLWHIDRKKGQLTAGGTLSGHKRGVWCARFSEYQQLVATCSGDLTIKLFSLVDKSCTRTFEGHQFAVLSVLFIDNGTKLVSVDGGGLIKLWDVKKGFCVRTEEAHNDKIWSLRALPSLDETENSGELCGAKARFMTGGADGQFALWADVSAEVKAETGFRMQHFARNICRREYVFKLFLPLLVLCIISGIYFTMIINAAQYFSAAMTAINLSFGVILTAFFAVFIIALARLDLAIKKEFVSLRTELNGLRDVLRRDF
uniref:Uncharacterized protein n=1 Tax=Globodera rostochiensis TaxID=31243 RepID=A0A914ID44_GLORO